jgi:glucose-6-phosphate-specific signal transduction histidine kinase
MDEIYHFSYDLRDGEIRVLPKYLDDYGIEWLVGQIMYEISFDRKQHLLLMASWHLSDSSKDALIEHALRLRSVEDKLNNVRYKNVKKRFRAVRNKKFRNKKGLPRLKRSADAEDPKK